MSPSEWRRMPAASGGAVTPRACNWRATSTYGSSRSICWTFVHESVTPPDRGRSAGVQDQGAAPAIAGGHGAGEGLCRWHPWRQASRPPSSTRTVDRSSRVRWTTLRTSAAPRGPATAHRGRKSMRCSLGRRVPTRLCAQLRMTPEPGRHSSIGSWPALEPRQMSVRHTFNSNRSAWRSLACSRPRTRWRSYYSLQRTTRGFPSWSRGARMRGGFGWTRSSWLLGSSRSGLCGDGCVRASWISRSASMSLLSNEGHCAVISS